MNASPIYDLKVTLRDIDPPVWRRFRVGGKTTLALLHEILQIVMGWLDYHLYEFAVGDQRYEAPEEAPEGKDPTSTPIDRVNLEVGSRFTYLYDWGDEWWHDIEVEAVSAGPDIALLPVCIAGERACPPEDCGGPPGYADLLRYLADPTDSEVAHLADWLEVDWSPEQFDVSEVNETLRAARDAGAI
ncbi:MAG: plasmid pRiA4b ORF-3 family protein [Gemmatimonadetes bacterium]|nr:plasmid pRiA4b ORF-3 family protein [Gemmatimonadota bacterium]